MADKNSWGQSGSSSNNYSWGESADSKKKTGSSERKYDWGEAGPAHGSNSWDSTEPVANSSRQNHPETEVFPPAVSGKASAQQFPPQEASRENNSPQQIFADPAYAQPVHQGAAGNGNGQSPGNDYAQGSGKGKRIAVVVGAIVAVLVLAGGITWAAVGFNDSDGEDNSAAGAADSTTKESTPADETNEESTSSSTGSSAENTSESKSSEPAKNATVSREEKCGRYADGVADFPGELLKFYCDGTWLYVGQDGSSNYGLFYWANNDWKIYKSDGVEGEGSVECYDQQKLLNAGAPQELKSQLRMCSADSGSGQQANASGSGNSNAGYANMRCDGRWIMIAETVLVPPGGNPNPEADRVQQKFPGSKVIKGDACSSMRSQYEGQDVYAVYFDAGKDVNEVCRLKSQYGGNARSLNNNADFSDPC